MSATSIIITRWRCPSARRATSVRSRNRWVPSYPGETGTPALTAACNGVEPHCKLLSVLGVLVVATVVPVDDRVAPAPGYEVAVYG